MEGHRLCIADNLGLVVTQLLGELEGQFDLDALSDGGLLNLEAGRCRPLDPDGAVIDDDVDEVMGLDLFGGDAHG